METPKNESPDVTELPRQIPSAVGSPTSWNTLVLVGFAVLGLFVLYLVKGRSPKFSPALPEESVARSVDSLPPTLPMPIMPAARPTVNSSNDSHDETHSLRDVRRTSPIVIYNNAASVGSDASPSTTENSDSSVPMPSGFHLSGTASSHSTTLGDREFIIAQGKLLDAVLETAINTDQPGQLRALITNDIYGDNGRTVLLPRGSRLIGQYDSEIAQGQRRVFVIWKRVIRPDGIDMTLDSGGTDSLGQAGIEGQVNHHFFTMFGAATLLSIIGASASSVGVGPQDANNSLSNARTSIAQGFNDAASTVLGVFVRIKPTLSARQGASIKVFVARDLYFDPAALSAGHVQVIP